MRARPTFIAAIGLWLVGLPAAVQAEQPKHLPQVGFLHPLVRADRIWAAPAHKPRTMRQRPHQRSTPTVAGDIPSSVTTYAIMPFATDRASMT
jgi:hypothetical protein